jgi:hypothetical protein
MPSRRTFFETILLKFKYLISYQSIPENILTRQDNFYYEQEYLFSCDQRVGSHVGSKGMVDSDASQLLESKIVAMKGNKLYLYLYICNFM